ncbi:uncharacterized protein MAM_03223 [Metarhizium album ARSEF 1941]|uniref:Uncharacterized protein n=1 Tax=Metarhizium album (strain ARSEF 1941) TaxID=1081103 RepID=A0A0B2WRU4_METAS|nr:uncharacterized protein MAM_03223 [Metarhizium album ARSEF 1941]KHN98761.1 hypothetical protein MAM_03223 [Metarhizium album ARSEF 1941]
MARLASSSTGFTASSGDDADVSLSPLDPYAPNFHRRSHTGVDGPRRADKTLNRSCSDFQSHGVSSNLYAGDLHDTMWFGAKLRARRAKDDVAALVDFLKNHPPPPDNFMSVPYEDEVDSRGRWSKIKKMGRRSRSMPKQPRHIQLPDSAVAGVTTGGHRHIAISIPIEATPYGLETRSQYPVFTHDMQMGTPSKESIRTFRNSKGVVTVLRPLTQVYESDAGSVTKSRCSDLNSQGRRPPPLPPHKPTNSLTCQPYDYIGTLPTKFDSPLLDDSSAPWHIPPTSSKDEGAASKQNPAAFRLSSCPARASSTAGNRSVRYPPSIDGLISPQGQIAEASNRAWLRYFPNSFADAPQRAHSSKNRKPLERTTIAARRSESGPAYNRDFGPAPSRYNSQTRETAPTTDGLGPSQEEDHRPTSSGSARSRKDKVREKKRRDIEAAMWKVKVKAQQQKDASHAMQRPSIAQPSARPAAKASDEASTALPSPLTLALSDLMVVMDVEPYSVDDEKDEPVRPKTAPAMESREESSETRVSPTAVEKPSNTAALSMSTREPQSQQGGASDRTSLTRRREWKAVREQERRARDAMAVARARAQQLASGGLAYENGAVSQADKEVMRLYEAHREHRLRDMERRLSRLERNGDVWLQALVPVLEHMNRTVASSRDGPIEDIGNWASDGKASGMTARNGQVAETKRLTRRPSSSHARLLGRLTDYPCYDDGWSGSASRIADASGLGTIEPLMRELAGEARRRQETTQSPVATNGGQFHAM